MKPHESPRIRKKSIRGDLGDSWPVWNRGIRGLIHGVKVKFLWKISMKTKSFSPLSVQPPLKFRNSK